MVKLVYLRSSDGIEFSFLIGSLVAQVPYFTYVRDLSLPSTSTSNSNNPPRLVVDLTEPSEVLQPLFAHLDDQTPPPDFDVLGFDLTFAIFQAGYKYGITNVAEDARLSLRSEIFINRDIRDHAMQLSILCGDPSMIQFTATVIRELGSLTVAPLEESNPSGFNVNSDLPRVHALAEEIRAAKARNAPREEIEELMELEARALADLRGRLASEDDTAPVNLGRTIPSPAPVYYSSAGRSARSSPISMIRGPSDPFIDHRGSELLMPEDLPPAYDQVQLEGFGRGSHTPRTTSERSFRGDYGGRNYSRDESELARLRSTPSEMGTVRSAGWREASVASREGLRAARVSRTSELSQEETAVNTPAFKRPGFVSSPTFWAVLFFVLAIGGMATELALSIVITQGTQATDQSLKKNLMTKVTCADLGPTTLGSCKPPFHWSIVFALSAPILYLSTLLWTGFFDKKAVYRFTGYATLISLAFAITALAGTTVLAVQGYPQSDCSTCPNQIVYVPLRKLRDMNRGQAAGAWFTLLGLGISWAVTKLNR